MFAVGLLAACSSEPAAAPSASASASATAAFVSPSGLEVESEEAARAALTAQRVEAERVAAEAIALAAAQTAAAEAAARQAADEAAAAQAVINAEGGCPPGWSFDDVQGCVNPDTAEGDGYEFSDLEVRCSDGTATVEECFGPGSDLNDNGIADVNE
ncbi:hypothetical protein [Modestobacter sp. URMC 112]